MKGSVCNVRVRSIQYSSRSVAIIQSFVCFGGYANAVYLELANCSLDTTQSI